MKNSLPTIGGSLALLLWSLTALFAVELSRIPTMQLLSVTCGIGALMILSSAYFKKEKCSFKQPLKLWIIGASTVSLSRITFILAFQYAPSAQVDLINYLWPVMVIVFSGFLPKEKFTISHTLSAVGGFFAVYFLFSDVGENFTLKKEHLTGYGFAFVGAVSWACYSIFSRHQSNANLSLIGVYSGITAIICGGLHLRYEQTIVPTAYECFLLAIMGVGLSGASYLLWDNGIKKGDFKLLSTLSYLVPPLSVGFLVAFGHARWTGTLIISTLLIFVSSTGEVLWSALRPNSNQLSSKA